MSSQDTGQQTSPLFNPYSPDFLRDPYPSFALLRQGAPLIKTPIGLWLASRFEDVSSILKDKRFGKDFESGVKRRYGDDIFERSRVYSGMRHWMLVQNPPDHTRMRGLVARLFTPKELNKLVPRIQSLVDQLIDAVEERGEMEFMSEFAFPLPLNVICDMMGFPEEDRHRFTKGSTVGNRLIDPTPLSDAELEEVEQESGPMRLYYEEQIEDRRRNPKDDMLTLLVQAEEAGDRLSTEELIANANLLFAAGHETTVNLLGNGLLALLSNPEQFEKLKADPDLTPGAVEEILRFNSSVQMTTRTALEDIELHGQTLTKGESVICLLGAANRDEARYEQSEEFDVTRKNVRPMSFGGGIHHCIGAPLARMEADIALRALAKRLPGLKLKEPTEGNWRPAFTLRGLQDLPVSW